MTDESTTNEEPIVASEPGAVYASHRNDHSIKRLLTAEECASCVTLDELKSELLDMVHDFYHPKS